MKENNDTIKDLMRKVDHMVLMSAQLEESKLKCKRLGEKKEKLIVKYRSVKSELDVERESKEKAEKKLRKYVKKQGASDKYKEKIKRLEEDVETNEVKCKELSKKRIEMYKRYTKSVKSNKELRDTIIKLEKKIEDQNKIIESLKNTKDEKKSNKEDEEDEEEEKINVKEVRMKKLRGMTLMNLKDLCKSKGVGGYSKYNKIWVG
jgi:predicted RNase H-like nuclease (RuvC/YqgF family)